MLSAALVGPSWLVGSARSLPRWVLDVVDRDRVAGRRASLRGDRAMIEVRGVGRADGARFGARLMEVVEQLPQVRWAGFNAPLARIIVTLEHPQSLPLADLVAVVEQVERDYFQERQAGERPGAGDAPRQAAPSPVDRSGVDQALWALAVTGTGLVLSAVGVAARFTPLPAELAALATVIDNQPRVRGLVEAVLGRPATDVGLAVLGAAGQGLAGGRVGLAVDTASRVSALAEARAAHAAWRAQEGELLADRARAAAEPVVAERPRPLPPGPVETYADQAAAVGLGALGVALPATGHPRRAVNLALAAVPKAARLGREGFATGLGRLLAGRGAVVLDAAVLRRLDRVDTVVLDADVLVSGQLVLGEVIPLAGVEPTQVAEQLYALFRASDPTATRRREEWVLGPVQELVVAQHRGAAEGERLLRAGAVHVLGLVEGSELLAVAGVVAEPSESVEALAAAAHRAGVRLVLAGTTPGTTTALADTVLPGGERLLGTVRGLQAHGAVVLLVSRHRGALGNADVGIGVNGRDGRPAWGAHVLVGNDLELAALLIEACGPAKQISHRGVLLSQAGSLLGAVGALTGSGWGEGSGPGQAAMLGVNGAAAVALAQGAWAARQVGRRPLDPPISRIPWHAMPVEAVLDQLSTTPGGLSATEVARRRRGHQPELLRPSLARAVAEELDNPLTPILAGGAALSAAVGSVTDAGLVAGVSALSALVGGVQRLRTDRAVAALLASSAITARVLRDGQPISRPADQLVAGDVVELRSGDVVPADCRVLNATGLQVDESALTGEPFPVTKHRAPVVAATVAERTSMLYEGTSVAAGRGSAIVVATGASTETGRSMAATRGAAPPTGVETRLAEITNFTLPIALGSAGAVIAAGLLWGRPLRESLGAGVSLAVASVPEGLPFLVSAAQLASARRLSAHGALVRNPRTIEALGRVDTLCFDKTGTLTQGRITLAAVADTTSTEPVTLDQLGHSQRRILAAGLRATPPRRGGQRLAHLTDQAVAEGAQAAGITRDHDLPGWRQLAVLPFEPSRGYHASLGALDDTAQANTALLSVKGAPETVLPRCTQLRSNNRDIALEQPARAQLQRRVTQLAGQGYRVLAVAERRDHVGHRLDDSDVTGLALLGFLALSDPVRPAAGASISELRHAGIQIVMITGDHPGTAQAIASRLEVLNGGRVITGPELDALDDDALDQVLPTVTVVARGTPAHKVRVVQAFQRLHRTVAMTGDGANDAPAIRLADVGIALGRRATPAARAAADLVVTDDRLETIIAALIEGRGMWASVRQALGILVGGNLGEIAFTVLGAALTGQSPLNTRQLLLVNLLTDLAPAMAIALRPPDAGSTAALLAEGPEASLGAALTRDITNRALTTATAATAAWTAARLTGRTTRARTIALAALVGTQLGQTLAIGGPSPAVLTSSLGSAAALAGIIQTPGLSHFFGCTPLGPLGWTIATTATTTTLLIPPLLHRLREPSSSAPK